MAEDRDPTEKAIDVLGSDDSSDEAKGLAARTIGRSAAIAKRNAGRSRSAANEFMRIVAISTQPLIDVVAGTKFHVNMQPVASSDALDALGELGDRRILGQPSDPAIGRFLLWMAKFQRGCYSILDSVRAFIPLFRVGARGAHVCFRFWYKRAREPGIKYSASRCMGDYSVVRHVFWRIFTKSEATADVAYKDGLSALEHGNRERAHTCFAAAITHWPWEPAHWIMSGRARYELGEEDGGASDLRFAGALCPFDPEVLLSVATTFEDWHMPEDVVEWCAHCLNPTPGHGAAAEAHWKRGKAYEAIGDHSSAAADYRIARDLLAKMLGESHVLYAGLSQGELEQRISEVSTAVDRLGRGR